MKLVKDLTNKLSKKWLYIIYCLLFVLVLVGVWRVYEKWNSGTDLFDRNELVTEKKDLRDMYQELELRLSATEKQVEYMEAQLSLHEKGVKNKISKEIEPFKKKIASHVNEIDKKVSNQIGQIREETAKRIHSVEQKINKVEKQNEQIHTAKVDSTIKKEVSEQVTMLRKEAQQREKEKQKKKLLNHFLDQLAKEGSDSAD